MLLARVLDREALEDDASVDLAEVEPQAWHLERVYLLEGPRLKRDRDPLSVGHDIVALGLAQPIEETGSRRGDLNRRHAIDTAPEGQKS